MKTDLIKNWNGAAPDWVVCLANECAASSQRKIAQKLGRSGALVNQVLQNKYGGDLQAIEARVRGLFMQATIECPALGQIPSNECQDWQAKARNYCATNMLRAQMYRACTGCPNNKSDKT